MEQDERAVFYLTEGNTEQGGDDPATAPALAPAAILDGAKDGGPECVSEADDSVHGIASKSANRQDLEVIYDDLVRAVGDTKG